MVNKYQKYQKSQLDKLYNQNLNTISDFINNELYLAFSRPTGDGSIFIVFREKEKLEEMLDLGIETIKIEKALGIEKSFFDTCWSGEKMKQDNIKNGYYSDFPDGAYDVAAIYTNQFCLMVREYKKRLGDFNEK